MARQNRFGLKQNGGGIWHCDFSVSRRRIQRSTHTSIRSLAEEWCAKVESDTWREIRLGEQPTLTWEQATEMWVKSKRADGKRSIEDDTDKITVLMPYLKDTKLLLFTTRLIDDTLDDLTTKRELSTSTRNRYRSLIVGVLNFARKKGYDVAVVHPEKRAEPKDKVIFISMEVARRLLDELRGVPHLRRMVEFSLATGLRQSNVTGLTWDRVDLDRRIAWIEADDAKGGNLIQVPLNDWAINVLIEARNDVMHAHERLCFSYYGKRVSEPANTAWHKACAALGELLPKGWTWHKMRHTWASWHRMGLFSNSGTPTPLDVLQKLGGWSDIKMVMKYAHLAPDYTAKFAGERGLQ